MNKKDFTDTIIIFLIIWVMAFRIITLTTEGHRMKKKINELENTVEQQIELIDALQQYELQTLYNKRKYNKIFLLQFKR